MASFRRPWPAGLPPVALQRDEGTLARALAGRPGALGRDLAFGHDARGRAFSDVPLDTCESTLQSKAESDVVQALQARLATTPFAGVSYRLIRAAAWSRYQRSGCFEIVERENARSVLLRIANEPGASQAETSALRQAGNLLADTTRSVGSPGLLLLRIIRARRSDRQADEPALTPSQLARLRTPPEEPPQDHWIAIELRWGDGTCVESERYEITTPDGRRFEGVTNEYGRAHVEGIESAGQCRIVFPRLDKDYWAPA